MWMCLVLTQLPFMSKTFPTEFRIASRRSTQGNNLVMDSIHFQHVESPLPCYPMSPDMSFLLGRTILLDDIAVMSCPHVYS
ncbi:Hypothetical predicted protein [Podarcis lilfordi]|uniref:Uncharacterized protein n=1 Tax=Podarcis lilfordi TaxID=74358 RepID=A0AA35JPB9_9SAUR|nr:Hypothetical predicted protein [Podarcis lilfordi]